MKKRSRTWQPYWAILVIGCILFSNPDALFANELDDDDVPVSVVPYSVDSDLFTGALTTQVSIQVPPGRNGMQPDLALTYSSSNGNGWLGMGWKLPLGAIKRQKRFGVNYSTDDYTFELSGISTDLIAIGGGEYRAKIENDFTRLRKLIAGDGRAYWEVTDKKGIKYLFGQTAASRVADPGDASKIFKWRLDWVVDRDGNYMKVTYVTDLGQTYLSEIRYAGYTTNGLESGSTIAPPVIIKFYLETPGDVPAVPMYTANFSITTAKRLKTIEERVNGNLVRIYKLGYSASTNTGHSRLTTVQQVGSDAAVDSGTGTVTGGTALPAVTFGYQAGPESFTDGAAWMSGWCSGGTYAPVDVNGDGKQDLWCQYPTGSPGLFNQLQAVSNGNGTLSNWGNSLSNNSCPGLGQAAGLDNLPPADLTGDGLQDLWCIFTGYYGAQSGPVSRWSVAASNAAGTYALASWTSLPITNWFNGVSGANNGISLSLDFDGDGKSDLLTLRNSGATSAVRISTGTAFDSTANGIAIPTICSVGNTRGVGDFNGDGKQDIWCHIANTSTTVQLSTGSGVVTGPSLGNWCAGGTVSVGDFNGDGKQEFVCRQANGTILITLSTGSAFTTPSTWATTWCASGDFGVSDFNGDGKSDLYCHPTGGTTAIALSTGVTFVDEGVWMSNWCSTGSFGVGDFNGDGKQDLYCINSGQVQVARSGNTVVLPDLLVSIANGIGGTTTIAYTPSTQYTNTQLPSSLQIVSSITTNDGNGNNATTTYTYSGGFRHIAERDFRGFNYAKVTGPMGPNGEQTITETWFHQGNDLAVDVNTPNVATGYMKGKPYRTKVSRAGSPNVPMLETTTSYLADPNGAAPWFNPPALVTTTTYDSAGSVAKLAQTESVTYDAYGNLTLRYDRGDATNNNALTSDDKTLAITFGNYDTTNWLVAFPTVQATYAGLGTGGTKLRETKYFYDGTGSCTTPAGNLTPTKGHVTKVEQWLNGGTNPISGMEYNVYGGLTCSRDPLGNTTLLAYDPTNSFTLTRTNALGHVTTRSYYGVNGVALDTGLYGQVKSVTDPNTHVVTTTYDALGRTLTITSPASPTNLITTAAYPLLAEWGQIGTQKVQLTRSGGGLATNLVSKAYFDGFSRTIKTEGSGPADGGGSLKVLVTETQYDVRGLVKQTSLPYIQGSESVTDRWQLRTYDALNRLTQHTNPDNTKTQFCYSGWVTTTIDPKLHKKVETKNAYGQLATVQEYTGTQVNCTSSGGTLYATTAYTYNQVGNLLTVTDTNGNVTAMTYDTLGRKLTMHDPDMGDWSYLYDAADNLTKQTDAKGQILWFRYDALNRRSQKDFTTQKAQGSGDVVYIYDGTTFNRKGRLQTMQDATGSMAFEYDPLGNVSKSTRLLDGITYATGSTYDGLGRLTSVDYPTNPVKTVTYAYDGPQLRQITEGATNYVTYAGWNAMGQPGTATFGNGVVTAYTYAHAQNATCSQQSFRLCTLKTSGPGSGSSGVLAGSVAAQPNESNLTTEGTADWVHLGLTTSSSVNRKAGVTPQIGTITAVGGGVIERYSAFGPSFTWTDGTPTGSVSQTLTGIYVVGVNKGMQFTVPADQTTRTLYVHVEAWRAQGKFEATLSDGSAAAFVDTSLNNTSGGSVAGIYVVQYKAAAAGQTLTVQWTSTALHESEGDVSLRGVALTTGQGSSGVLSGSVTVQPSESNLTTEGTGDWVHLGLTTSSSVNRKAGVTPQIGTVTAVGGGVIDNFSPYGPGISWTDGTPTGSVSQTLTGVYVAGVNKGMQFTVPADQATRTLYVHVEAWRAQGKFEATLSDGSAAAFVETSLNNTGGGSLTGIYVLQYKAASAGQTLTVQWTTTAVHESGGNVSLRGVALTTGQGGGGGSPGATYQNLTYSFDAAGNLEALTDPLNGNQALSYDALDRLTQATGPYGTSGATASITYEYDAIGNLIKNTQLSATPYTYPPSGSSSVRPHAVSTAGGHTYSYDNNGNVTGGAGRTYTWNPENKPLTIAQGGTTTTFVYDGDGGRAKKIVGGTTKRYISKLYECETTGAGTTCTRVIWAGDTRIATVAVNTGTVHYWHPDHLGSSTVITDSTGAQVQAVAYHPYGAIRTNESPSQPPVDVPYKYTGQELDVSTGLHDYDARQYDSLLGRFISADIFVPEPRNPQTLNRYAYVTNNPVRYNDPTGYAAQCINSMDSPGGCSSTQDQLLRLQETIVRGAGPDIVLRETVVAPPPFFPVSPPVMYTLGSGVFVGPGGPSYLGVAGRPPDAAVTDPILSPGDLMTVVKAPFSIAIGIVKAGIRILGKETADAVVTHQHHIFPQAQRFSEEFKSLNIDVHEFTMELPVSVHRMLHRDAPGGGLWNQAWDQFFKGNESVNAEDVFRHAGELFHRFNLDKYAAPIVPYGRR